MCERCKVLEGVIMSAVTVLHQQIGALRNGGGVGHVEAALNMITMRLRAALASPAPRPTPTCCRHEPPFPSVETIMCAGSSDLVAHAKSERCSTDGPHAIAVCGLASPAPEAQGAAWWRCNSCGMRVVDPEKHWCVQSHYDSVFQPATAREAQDIMGMAGCPAPAPAPFDSRTPLDAGYQERERNDRARLATARKAGEQLRELLASSAPNDDPAADLEAMGAPAPEAQESPTLAPGAKEAV